MFLRWLAAFGIASLILLILAIPLSIVRVTLDYRASGRTLMLYLADGSIGMQHWPPRTAPRQRGDVDIPRYDIEAGYRTSLRNGLPAWHWWRPDHTATSGNVSASVPLLYLIGLALLPLGLRSLLAWRADRQRKRLGLCRKCGYDLRGSLDRCPECGSPVASDPGAPTPASSPKPIGGLSVLISLVLLLALFMAGLCALDAHEVQSRESHNLRGFDYSWYSFTTTPRLSGQILTLQSIQNRAQAQQIPPGALVLVGEGELDLGVGLQLADVTLVGRGADRSRLKLQLARAERVRFDNLTIVCPDNPFAELREGGELQLTRCTITEYNTGHGGNDGVSGQDAVLLIEDCTFDGVPGGAIRGGHRGVAFDLRGSDYAFVRNTRFLDNGEIARQLAGMFDRCTGTNPSGRGNDLTVRDGNILARGNSPEIAFRGTPTPFSLSTDELAYAVAARDNKRTGDPLADRWLRRLRSHSDPRYWAALLRHGDADIRHVARERLVAMGMNDALLPATVDVAAALTQIAVGSPDANDLRLRILATGAAARDALKQAAAGGAERERAAAALILQALDAAPPLQHEAIFSGVAQRLDRK